jgi:hypothetical protein
MKIVEDHIVFIKIFSCSKLKTVLWVAYPNQTFKLSTHLIICLFEWFETGLISSLDPKGPITLHSKILSVHLTRSTMRFMCHSAYWFYTPACDWRNNLPWWFNTHAYQTLFKSHTSVLWWHACPSTCLNGCD